MPRLASLILLELEQRAVSARSRILHEADRIVNQGDVPAAAHLDRLADEVLGILESVPEVWSPGVWWDSPDDAVRAVGRLRCLEQSLALCGAVLLLTGRLGIEREEQLREMLAVQRLIEPTTAPT